MPRWLRALAMTVAVLAVIAGCTAWWLASAAQEVPEFYTRATAQLPDDPQALADAGRQMQAEVELLQKRVGQPGNWNATFTNANVNAWLATELQNQFPHVLPRGVRDPRVEVRDGKVLVAARYKSKRFDSVISFELRVRLTDQPNVLALEVVNLRAGAIPLPLKQFRDKIALAAERGDLLVEWSEEKDQPIALITVPSEHDSYATRPVVIEKIEVLEGEIILRGHSGHAALQAYRPVGPLFRTTSFSSKVTL